MSQHTNGYSINMRRDVRTGDNLAVIPTTYDQGRGKFYMAYTNAGWVELSPLYVTRQTRTVVDYPKSLKLAVDRNLGYVLNVAPKVYG